MSLAMVADRVNSGLRAEISWVINETPIAVNNGDEMGLKALRGLLVHHRHDLLAVAANLADLEVWALLTAVVPQVGKHGMRLLGKEDDNYLGVDDFAELLSSWLYEDHTPMDLYNIVVAARWWLVLVSKMLKGMVDRETWLESSDGLESFLAELEEEE